jgi:membrane protease YdiL (CAAX protease family)
VDPHAQEIPAAPDLARPWPLLGRWAIAIGGVALARLLGRVEPTGLLSANVAGVAALLFVLLPDRWLRARGLDWSGFGAPFLVRGGGSDATPWSFARSARLGLAVCAVLFPVFALAFAGFTALLTHLPPGLAAWLAPYLGVPVFAPRLPEHWPLQLLLQLLVVALPEELFYRGWLQGAWARLRPGQGVTVLGARLGAGFLATQLLFALGHLTTLQPWRLATFFPGLLFGWLRARTGSVVAPVLVHALSNFLLLTLERSFYP